MSALSTMMVAIESLSSGVCEKITNSKLTTLIDERGEMGYERI